MAYGGQVRGSFSADDILHEVRRVSITERRAKLAIAVFNRALNVVHCHGALLQFAGPFVPILEEKIFNYVCFFGGHAFPFGDAANRLDFYANGARPDSVARMDPWVVAIAIREANHSPWTRAPAWRQPPLSH